MTLMSKGEGGDLVTKREKHAIMVPPESYSKLQEKLKQADPVSRTVHVCVIAT